MDCKYLNKQKKEIKKNYKKTISKILLAVIFILINLIILNTSLKDNYKKHFFENLNIAKINNIYKKYIGSEKEKEVLTSYENIIYEEREEYEDGYKLKVGTNEIINVLKPGIIVYIGDKDNYKDTIIVQGNDGIDIWYSNITITEFKLYDYVTTGDTLGIANDDYIYLKILKDGNKIKYEEYFN